jgi:ABC-type sugar transport system substrate-binding protein
MLGVGGRTRVGAAIAVGALALTFAACGGDDSGSDSAAQEGKGSAAITDQAALDEAREVVTKYREEQKFVPPGPAIDVGDKVKGKTVYWIGNANQVPIVRRMLEAGQEALKTVGMNVIIGDAKGQPSLLLNEMDKAISRNVDAIVTTSFSPDSISAGLKAAKAANIPVILGFAGDPGIPSQAEKDMGIAAKPSYCYSCGGKVAAAAAIVDAADNGIDKIQAASFQAPESPNSVLGAKGFVDELKRLCPANCKVDYEDAPVAKWGPDLSHQVESLLRREPDLNYIYASFDNILDWAIPGIATVGATDRVRAIGFNGSDVPMQNLQDGKGPVVGEIWNPAHWTGWSMADAIIRTVLGEEPSDVPVTQDKLFMGDDAKNIDIKEERQESWYGDLDYAGEYKKLWGVQ